MEYKHDIDAKTIEAAIANGHALRSEAFYDAFALLSRKTQQAFRTASGLVPRTGNGYVAKIRQNTRLGISSLTQLHINTWRRQSDTPHYYYS